MPTGSTNSRDRVAQLVTEAAADSSGCFTLDPQAFWPKACQLRLAEPYHYLRCIFRGLVVLGAQWVHLTVDADDVYVCSDIGIPSVDNLMGYLFSPDPSAWPLQQLATGIQTAWNLPYRWIDVVSPAGGRRYFPRQPYPTPVPNRRHEDYDYFIHLKRQPGWNVVERWLKKQYPECHALRSGCDCHSVSVRVNGNELPRTNRGRAEHRYAHNWPANLEVRSLALPTPFDYARVPISVWLDPPSSGPGQLYWVVAGLAMETTQLPECPGLAATVALTTFPLDASQVKIRHGEEYQEVLDQVRWCWLERKANRGTPAEAQEAQMLVETRPQRAWAALRTRLQNTPLWPRAQALDGPVPPLASLDDIQKADRLIICPGPDWPVFQSALLPGDLCLTGPDDTLAQILRARKIAALTANEWLNLNRRELAFETLKPDRRPKGPCNLLFAGLLHDLHAAPGIGLRAHAYSPQKPPLQFRLEQQRVDLGRSFVRYRACHYYAWEEAGYFKILFHCPKAGIQLFCSQAKETVPDHRLAELRLKIGYLPLLLGLKVVFLGSPLVRELGEVGPNTSIFKPRPSPGQTSAWKEKVKKHACLAVPGPT